MSPDAGSRVRFRVIFGALFAGMLLIAAAILFQAPVDMFGGSRSVSPPTEAQNIVLRHHRILLRCDQSYADRIRTLEELRLSGMIAASGGKLEDDLVKTCEQLLSVQKSPQAATLAAGHRLVQSAPTLTGIAGRVGIPLGPRVPAKLLVARLKDANERRSFAAKLYEFEFFACVKTILARIAAPQAACRGAGLLPAMSWYRGGAHAAWCWRSAHAAWSLGNHTGTAQRFIAEPKSDLAMPPRDRGSVGIRLGGAPWPIHPRQPTGCDAILIGAHRRSIVAPAQSMTSLSFLRWPMTSLSFMQWSMQPV